MLTSDQVSLSLIKEVTSVCRYYKTQSSTLSAPSKPTTKVPSGWTTTEPSYSEGSTNSLYFVDQTIYSNGTWSYSDVSLSSAYEAAKVAYNKACESTTTQMTADEIQDTLGIKFTRYSLSSGNSVTVTHNGSTTRGLLLSIGVTGSLKGAYLYYLASGTTSASASSTTILAASGLTVTNAARGVFTIKNEGNYTAFLYFVSFTGDATCS